jgi:hypothetical protein
MNATKYLEALAPIDPAAMSVVDAKAAYASFRADAGWATRNDARLLSWADENLKLGKSGNAAVSLSLAPANSSGHNVCDASTSECRRGCVASSGNGAYPAVQRGRATKTRFLMANPQAFVTLLAYELRLALKRDPAMQCRLNTFSDLRWEIIAPALFDLGVTFYDYTKRTDRDAMPTNYDLTFSASEHTSDAVISDTVASGMNVAVVLGVKRKDDLPTTYLGIPVVDGDKTDERHLDPSGVIVGLRAKGKMRGGKWKMVRKLDTPVTVG